MTENHRMSSNPLFTRREMLGMSGTALAGMAAGSVSLAQEKRPRIACVITYWAAPGSHADWIITKLMDGYWWQGAHVPSRVDVVSALPPLSLEPYPPETGYNILQYFAT